MIMKLPHPCDSFTIAYNLKIVYNRNKLFGLVNVKNVSRCS